MIVAVAVEVPLVNKRYGSHKMGVEAMISVLVDAEATPVMDTSMADSGLAEDTLSLGGGGWIK